MSVTGKRIDRNSAEYKKEMFMVMAVVITLTLAGGLMLGNKIATAEAAKQSGEMQDAYKKAKGKVPGAEHGIMQ